MKKGSKIFIEGSLQTRKWVGNDGQEKFTTEVVLHGYGCKMALIGSYNSNASENDNNDIYEESGDPLDDIPF